MRQPTDRERLADRLGGATFIGNFLCVLALGAYGAANEGWPAALLLVPLFAATCFTLAAIESWRTGRPFGAVLAAGLRRNGRSAGELGEGRRRSMMETVPLLCTGTLVIGYLLATIAPQPPVECLLGIVVLVVMVLWRRSSAREWIIDSTAIMWGSLFVLGVGVGGSLGL